jgi:hypothetical protein
MEERHAGMEGNCKYIKQAVVDIRQAVVLHLGGWTAFKGHLANSAEFLGLGLVLFYQDRNRIGTVGWLL